jgi:hypothetical protein
MYNSIGSLYFSLSCMAFLCRSAAFKLLNYPLKWRGFRSAAIGHQFKDDVAKPIDLDKSYLLKKINNIQSKLQQPSMAENVRTLIHSSLMYGVLSTNSLAEEGYPSGSVVGFELDENGSPFFVLGLYRETFVLINLSLSRIVASLTTLFSSPCF